MLFLERFLRTPYQGRDPVLNTYLERKLLSLESRGLDLIASRRLRFEGPHQMPILVVVVSDTTNILTSLWSPENKIYHIL